MTVYELAMTIPAERRASLALCGIVGKSLERYIYIYELYLKKTGGGESRMQAYTDISQECYTSEDNVRRIVRKMQQEI